MGMTYTQLQDVRNRVVRDLAGHKTQLTTAEGAFTSINDALTQMQSQYAGWAAEIDQAAAQSPTNPAIMAMKADKDLILAEFVSTKNRAATLATAVNEAS